MELLELMEQRRRAILVGVNISGGPDDLDYSLEELANLADACGIEAVDRVTQNLQHANPATYIGTGKLQDVKLLIDHHEADLVIFDDELSPAQIRNLGKKLDAKVIDRTYLILEIFANRAKTRESQLQVEIAQLQYMLPRLVGMRESLGRQGGGVGLKNRGAGETKLELDRRKIESKISALQKELDTLVKQRHVQRRQRRKNEVPVVSIVGYTNAGKSTLMNAMLQRFGGSGTSGKQVFEKDMLFATLETSVRSMKLPDNKMFLLTDTVGFINKLPHHLVKAFRSTLEEAAEADLIIHVIDASNANHELFREITLQTLSDIGITDAPMIYAYNKADLLGASEQDGLLELSRHDETVLISAKQQTGLDRLTALIRERIFSDYTPCTMLIPFDQGHIVSYLQEHAHVNRIEYAYEGTFMQMECRTSDYEKYQDYVVRSV